MSRNEAAGLFSDLPLMTMRVSRDSGQTWEPERAVYTTEDLSPLLTGAWPPCECRMVCGTRSGFQALTLSRSPPR